MSRIKLSYIQPECEYRKPISLLYKIYYMNIVFTEKTISTLSSSSNGINQPHRQSTGVNARL
jgi:hypothetical protein